MKTKRIVVLGVALILLALVAGIAFAATNTDGVIWVVIEGQSSRLGRGEYKYYMEMHNSNDFPVNVRFSLDGNSRYYDNEFRLEAGETYHRGCFSRSIITSVIKLSR